MSADDFKVLRTGGTPVERDAWILDELRSRGLDLARPRDFVAYLYVPDEERADAAAAELTPLYQVEVLDPLEGETQWLVRANRNLVVDEVGVAAERARFEALAQRFSGEFDGWEAAAFDDEAGA